MPNVHQTTTGYEIVIRKLVILLWFHFGSADWNTFSNVINLTILDCRVNQGLVNYVWGHEVDRKVVHAWHNVWHWTATWPLTLIIRRSRRCWWKLFCLLIDAFYTLWFRNWVRNSIGDFTNVPTIKYVSSQSQISPCIIHLGETLQRTIKAAIMTDMHPPILGQCSSHSHFALAAA